jgi:glutamine cyclotransferase
MKTIKKLHIIIVSAVGFLALIFAQVVGTTEIHSSKKSLSSSARNNSAPLKYAPVYSYKIIKTLPHDPSAFTQGLVFENDTLYEGTGIPGRSYLRKINPETGDILKQYKLPQQFFGEGITISGDKIIQLTWRSRIGFVFDKRDFQLLRTFQYPTEGWGITYDGSKLIMSNGTSKLVFLDPVTFREIRQIKVHDGDKPVTNLNELEYIKGEIFANIWRSNRIAIVSSDTGRVTRWVDLEGIARLASGDKIIKTLNGIAYDAKNNRLFVTGKLWANIYEIRIVPLTSNP